MSEEVYEGELYVTRFTGPASEGDDRARWQFTPSGRLTDPLGHHYAVMTRSEVQDLACVLLREALR